MGLVSLFILLGPVRWTEHKQLAVQRVPITAVPYEKIIILVTVVDFFLPNLQLLQRGIQATYAAHFVTIFAVV